MLDINNLAYEYSIDIAKQIIAETCPNRKLKLENYSPFADIIQPKKYQKVI